MHTNITNNNKAFIPNLRSATRTLSFYFISFITLAILFVKLTSIISFFLSPRSMFVFIPHPWRLINYSPTTSVNWHANKSLLHISKPYQTIPLLSSSIKVMSNFFSTHSFLILSFSLLLLIHLNILISATLIFWMCS